VCESFVFHVSGPGVTNFITGMVADWLIEERNLLKSRTNYDRFVGNSEQARVGCQPLLKNRGPCVHDV